MCKLRSLPAWDNEKVKPVSAVVQKPKLETDDTEYLNVIADARLKLETDLAPAIPCATRGSATGICSFFRLFFFGSLEWKVPYRS